MESGPHQPARDGNVAAYAGELGVPVPPLKGVLFICLASGFGPCQKSITEFINQIIFMKNISLPLTAALALTILSPLGVWANELDSLAGKWVSKSTEAQPFKQVLEIRKNKFTFEIVRDGGATALFAEGEVKVEALGPFKTAKFYNIRGGSSPTELESVDDERTIIYSLDSQELTVAANFDKDRSQPPMVSKYVRVVDEAKTLVIDKIVMHKTPQSSQYYLCFDVSVGDATKRFNVPDKTYEKDGLTIVTDLAIPNVRKGATGKFVMKLDDVAGDECTEEMDNRSAGNFTVTDSGSQEFKPEDQWHYTLYWHLK